jgi:hypothetical protein
MPYIKQMICHPGLVKYIHNTPRLNIVMHQSPFWQPSATYTSLQNDLVPYPYTLVSQLYQSTPKNGWPPQSLGTGIAAMRHCCRKSLEAYSSLTHVSCSTQVSKTSLHQSAIFFLPLPYKHVSSLQHNHATIVLGT